MTRAAEVEAKLESLRGWLDHCDLDAVLITSQGGFAWITGGADNSVALGQEAGVASVLVTREDAYLLAANNELRRLVDEEAAGPASGFTPVEWPWHDTEGEGRIVERLCDATRAVSDLARLGLPAAPPDLDQLRFVLLPEEVERYRALGRDAAEGLELAALAARPGDTELDVAARLLAECRRRDVVAVVALVGADERIAHYRHPMPTNYRLARTLLISVTARRHGLHASLSRMVHFGLPDTDLAARHAAVLRVDARLIGETTPGASLGEVFEQGVQQYEREGYGGEWRLHHQGGLTGYAGREVFATPGAGAVTAFGQAAGLRAGQALAWNPTITRVKSEDTVVTTPKGAEVLTRTGAWPQMRVQLGGRAVERPALLVR